MEVTIDIADMQRVNSLIKLQNELNGHYELYIDHLDNGEYGFIEALKEEIELTKRAINQIKILRMAEKNKLF